MTDSQQIPSSDNGQRSGDSSGETLGAPVPEGRAAGGGSLQRDPDDWVTGDEPMTGAQRSYLDTLAREAGEQIPADLTKAQASEHIDRLQQATGRGASDHPPSGQKLNLKFIKNCPHPVTDAPLLLHALRSNPTG